MTLQATRPRRATARRHPDDRADRVEHRKLRRKRHWAWLAVGFPFAFAVPFLLADVLDLNRDLFYGLYALAVACFVAAWAHRHSAHPPRLHAQLALGARARSRRLPS